jgi:DNA ligase-1
MQMRNEIDNNSKLKIVDHYELKDLSEIDNYHDQFVADGYEGAVIRDAESKYNPGGRSRDWQKIKKFTDGEFEILGLVEGLREEDMCFLMKTKEGYEFKAKPIGTREDKQYYREHLNEMIGKMATVKYFGMTNTDQPVPNLPVFKNLVLEKDR